MPSPRAADDARRSARPLRPARSRRTAIAVIAAVGAAASMLTACTDEPAPEPTASPSTSASPTTEPTPTPTTTPEPERPAAMDDPGVEGAIATATYFLSLYPYVYNTGDLTAWKSLSHPECIFCASVVTNVEEMHGRGHRQHGPSVTIENVVGSEVEPGVFFTVDIDMVQGPTTEVDGQGATVEEAPTAKPVHVGLAVVRDGDRWWIRGSEATSAVG